MALNAEVEGQGSDEVVVVVGEGEGDEDEDEERKVGNQDVNPDFEGRGSEGIRGLRPVHQ